MTIYKVFYEDEQFDGDGYYSWNVESLDYDSDADGACFNTYHMSLEGAQARVLAINKKDEYKHKIHMEERIKDGYEAWSFHPFGYKIREITLEL